ncbi:hypothetical protein ACOBR2_08670 [Telmatobacter bradus]|uniref:hypothetical protein n=1 Tax=Telmatobacter bradus TaxID=474953 RepID=UPI003B4329F1
MTALTDTGHITTRKLKGRTRRAVTLSTKITPQELELITAASEANGRALGEWVREVLLTEIHSPSIALGADQLMTEIIGLQLFLTNALAPIVCGEHISAEQYDDLMRNVKATKRQAAQEVIAQYIEEKKEANHA